MNIRTVKSYSSGRYLYKPGIEQSGMALTITFEGEVRWEGIQYDPPGDFEFAATGHETEEVGVCGYLVLDSGGELDLLIDQVGGDFPAARYEFEPDGPYTHVALLFSFRVPPGAETLDDVEGVLYQLHAREGDGDSPSQMKDMVRRQAAVRAEAMERAAAGEPAAVEPVMIQELGTEEAEEWKRVLAQTFGTGE